MNGADVTYAWDGLNRLAAANDARLGRTTFTYDAAGNLSGYAYPNGVSTTNQFDLLHRVTSVASLNAQLALINRYNYTLNASGKRLAVEEPGRRRVDYTYDSVYRLTREAVTGGQGTLGVNYTYDAVGNRLTRDAQNHSYDANDRISGATYDANGNTVVGRVSPSAPLVNDRYDFEDRLIGRQTTLNNQPTTINQVYDGDGNRVSKTVGGVTTYYLVDELNPSGYAQVLEELVSINSQLPTLSRVYSYDYALNSQDQLLEDGQGGWHWVASFYGYDDHGSVRYLTDMGGNVTDLYDHDAFGNLVQQGGNTPNLYLYAGEQFDPDLQLYYLRARYLNPDTGRFWTRDPFEGFLDDPASLNGYLYANSDPVNNWDPSGYESLAEVQQSSGISARLRLPHLSPRFAKGKASLCNALGTANRAVNAYQTAQQVSALAAGAGAATGMGASVVANVLADEFGNYLIETFNLKGLEQVELFTEEANITSGMDIYRSRQTPCFTAGTLVSTEQGLRPIETLKVGDRVWALGQGTVEVGLKPITEVFRNEVTNLVILTVGGERIETTPDHPFWVKNEGWIEAGDLRAGDELLARGGTWLPITAVESRQGRFMVFNLEVEGFHSYYVGVSGLLVHNASRSIIRPPSVAKRMADKFLPPSQRIPIVDIYGCKNKQVGWRNAKGDRVVRWPHRDKGTPRLHWNLVNNATRNNIHVIVH